ncbi:HIPL1 protein-like [Cornus florida]|uniref:HIPL1 protein-like n=1 Tax=Cornus florida TaxID=4283 RepID=UPI00289C3E5B|nr:HIPL1 protein-like [Cornus florida]
MYDLKSIRKRVGHGRLSGDPHFGKLQECVAGMVGILEQLCDQFSAQLFRIDLGLRNAPALCNSTNSVELLQSKGGASTDFCMKVWDICGNIPILNSLFVPSLRRRAGISFDSSPSKLLNLWQSKRGFCEAFGVPLDDGVVCFDGETILFSNAEDPQPPQGLCLEKIGNGSYINMVPHPDGSSQVFLNNQQGKIWLATIPREGSKDVLGVHESNSFMDITEQVLFQTEFGVIGMTFHPKFTNNGRFFVSFNCDKIQHPGCSCRCSCNTDINCDPTKLGADNGIEPYQYHTVIAEFYANGKSVNPSEVRRIFMMGLPYRGALFGSDGYLYFMMGDGSRGDDPYNFSQNKKSLLRKILRFDIDNIPTNMLTKPSLTMEDWRREGRTDFVSTSVVCSEEGTKIGLMIPKRTFSRIK